MPFRKEPYAWKLTLKDWRFRTLCSCKIKEDSHGLSVWDLMTPYNMRRKGYATKLLRKCQSVARKRKLLLWLRVDENNSRAVRLYEKCGFTRTKELGEKEGHIYFWWLYK